MTVEFFPRAALLDAFKAGWRLIPAYEYHPGDWAILLYKPECRTVATVALIDAWIAKVAPAAKRFNSNASAARASEHYRRSLMKARAA